MSKRKMAKAKDAMTDSLVESFLEEVDPELSQYLKKKNRKRSSGAKADFSLAEMVANLVKEQSMKRRGFRAGAGAKPVYGVEPKTAPI